MSNVINMCHPGRKYRVLFNDNLVVDDGDHTTVYRIQALKDFADVKEGDLGGYVSNARNLDQEGSCWVYDGAYLVGMSHVTDHAVIYSSKPDIMCVVKDSVVGHYARIADSLVQNCDIKGQTEAVRSNLADLKAMGKTRFGNAQLQSGSYFGKTVVNDLSQGAPV